METRDVRVPLFDIVEAAGAVESFLAGRSRADYDADLLLRSGVERQLLVVGEAMARVLRMEPALDERFPESGNVIGLRNVLAHAYDRIVDALVWEVATDDLPRLASEVRALLEAPPSQGCP
jgi:uncharacterized protein with HEPN domain